MGIKGFGSYWILARLVSEVVLFGLQSCAGRISALQ